MKMNRNFSLLSKGIYNHHHNILNYCLEYSKPLDSLRKNMPILKDLEMETKEHFGRGADMMITILQGIWLCDLVNSYKFNNILELGTFTGMSSICMASGIGKNGRVTTCDIDMDAISIAKRYIDKCGFQDTIITNHCNASDLLTRLDHKFDMIFIDADKKGIPTYVEHIINNGLLNPNGLIVIDNALFQGKVTDKDDTTPMAVDMHKSNKYLYNHNMISTYTILPLFDGMGIAKLKNPHTYDKY